MNMSTTARLPYDDRGLSESVENDAGCDRRQRRVLVVEDDARLAMLVSRYLEDAGYSVAIEGRGDRVVARLAEFDPHVVLLDIALPGKNGFDVCREIRLMFHGAIVILTAKTEEIDEVLGLELGADDYLAKPVRPRALLARLSRLFRVTGQTYVEQPFSVGSIWIAPARREVTVAGLAIDLTSLEFDLLVILAKQPGTVLSRDALYRELRGIDWDGIDRWVDLAISRVRRKLGDVDLIKTVRNRGYMLVAGPR